MGIFNGIFGKGESGSNSKLQWNYLETIQDLDDATEKSNHKVVVFFKHSTRCSVSRFVLKQFENNFSISNEQMEIYFLDLIEYRSISNEIATRFGVTHQSPQLIVIQDGKAIFNTSHESIDTQKLIEFV